MESRESIYPSFKCVKRNTRHRVHAHTCHFTYVDTIQIRLSSHYRLSSNGMSNGERVHRL